MSVLFLDFETRSAVDLKKAGADVYARDPSTDILCMGYAVDDEPVCLWTPPDLFPRAVGEALHDPTVTFCAHNAAFELAIWNYCMFYRYGTIPLTADRVVCTLAMAYAMALPGALADAAPAVGLTINKDSQGHRIMMQLSQPRDFLEDGSLVWWEKADVPEKFERLYSYCKQDVEVERQLYKRLLRLSPSEQALWQLDHKINQRGVRIDLQAVKAALEMADAEKASFDVEMRSVTKGAVATAKATGQLTDWLKVRGFQVDGVAKADVTELLERELPPDVRRALEIRQLAAKTSTAKLTAMLKGVCSDGRLRGMFQYCGAGQTGRFAGRRVQLHNLPRPSLAQDDIERIFKLLEGVG